MASYLYKSHDLPSDLTYLLLPWLLHQTLLPCDGLCKLSFTLLSKDICISLLPFLLGTHTHRSFIDMSFGDPALVTLSSVVAHACPAHACPPPGLHLHTQLHPPGSHLPLSAAVCSHLLREQDSPRVCPTGRVQFSGSSSNSMRIPLMALNRFPPHHLCPCQCP